MSPLSHGNNPTECGRMRQPRMTGKGTGRLVLVVPRGRRCVRGAAAALRRCAMQRNALQMTTTRRSRARLATGPNTKRASSQGQTRASCQMRPIALDDAHAGCTVPLHRQKATSPECRDCLRLSAMIRILMHNVVYAERFHSIYVTLFQSLTTRMRRLSRNRPMHCDADTAVRNTVCMVRCGSATTK